jgi:hypothetical protein
MSRMVGDAGVAFTMDVMFCDYISYLATIEFISHMHVI